MYISFIVIVLHALQSTLQHALSGRGCNRSLSIPHRQLVTGAKRLISQSALVIDIVWVLSGILVFGTMTNVGVPPTLKHRCLACNVLVMKQWHHYRMLNCMRHDVQSAEVVKLIPPKEGRHVKWRLCCSCCRAFVKYAWRFLTFR